MSLRVVSEAVYIESRIPRRPLAKAFCPELLDLGKMALRFFYLFNRGPLSDEIFRRDPLHINGEDFLYGNWGQGLF